MPALAQLAIFSEGCHPHWRRCCGAVLDHVSELALKLHYRLASINAGDHAIEAMCEPSKDLLISICLQVATAGTLEPVKERSAFSRT
jgi:hypothetical protein